MQLAVAKCQALSRSSEGTPTFLSKQMTGQLRARSKYMSMSSCVSCCLKPLARMWSARSPRMYKTLLLSLFCLESSVDATTDK
eukprot:4102366-Amphidinium_carterae.2